MAWGQLPLCCPPSTRREAWSAAWCIHESFIRTVVGPTDEHRVRALDLGAEGIRQYETGLRAREGVEVKRTQLALTTRPEPGRRAPDRLRGTIGVGGVVDYPDGADRRASLRHTRRA